MTSRVVYPAARRAAYSYVKHGHTVEDPYHYLEDPTSEETKSFVRTQQNCFKEYMAPYPHRQAIYDAIQSARNAKEYGAPQQRKPGFVYRFNPGLLNQPQLMLLKDLAADDTQSELFLDVMGMSPDGTTYLTAAAWSSSDRFFSYGTADKGKEDVTVHIRDVERGVLLEEEIKNLRYTSLHWLRDDGFFYSRFPDPAVLKNHSCYYHRVGTTQDADVLVFSYPDVDTCMVSVDVSDDDRHALVSVRDGCEPNVLIFVAPLPENFSESPALLDTVPLYGSTPCAEWDFLGNDGDDFYFTTTLDAPRSRVVSINIQQPGTVTEIVPVCQQTLEWARLARDTLMLCYIDDVKHVLRYRPLRGGSAVETHVVPLPVCTIGDFSARRTSDFVGLCITSFFMPMRVLWLSASDPGVVHRFRDVVVEGLNSDDYAVRQIFYDSDGGVRVPMYVCHHKDLPPGQPAPTILYGYGGFNVSLLPVFTAWRLVFMRDMGGVFAVASIRGGAEYGKEWHDGGKKFNKMNCFVDFIRGAKELIRLKYTNSDKLSIMGGSNGGLLVAACANLEPSLFKAVIAQVGVLDMYNFHRWSIGHAWMSDYGDPEREEDFKYLTKYSPLHNIRVGEQYPAILVLTAENDERVVPAHSLKYLATLQHANPEVGGPFLGRIESSAGHGAGNALSKQIDISADILSFLGFVLRAPWHGSPS